MRLTRLGVIDLGSNSGRLILALRQVHGIPLVVDEATVSLRLAEGLQATGQIGAPAIARALAALRAFRIEAEHFGVQRLIAVGTSALRDASNGPAVVDELQRDSGIPIEVLSGEREAYYGYLAAVNSLPISDGLVLDLGGGSLELSFLSARSLQRAVSLPLGALRLNERFLRSDPPNSAEIADFRAYVEKRLRESGVRKLTAGQLLVGAGGTVRSLAKLVRKSTGSPSVRLHGYAVETAPLRALTRSLLAQPISGRRRMAGLSAERAEIIGAGAIIVQAVVEATGARSLLVCGQGLREGIAFAAFRAHKAPVVRDVRGAGVDAFRERYVTGALRQFTYEESPPGEGDFPHAPASHPSDGVEPLALHLLELLSEALPAAPADRELLAAAAALCDAGRAISLYRWAEHAVYLLTNGDLAGYTQQEALIIGQVIAAQSGQRIESGRSDPPAVDSNVLRIGRLGVVLGLARWLRRRGVTGATPLRMLTPAGGLLVLVPSDVPLAADEWGDGIIRGCRRFFERDLHLAHSSD